MTNENKTSAKVVIAAVLTMLFIAMLAQYWQYALGAVLLVLERINNMLEDIGKHSVVACLLVIIYMLSRIRKAVESLKEAK